MLQIASLIQSSRLLEVRDLRNGMTKGDREFNKVTRLPQIYESGQINDEKAMA